MYGLQHLFDDKFLQVVNRLVASWLSKFVINRLATDCFNKLQQVCKWHVETSQILIDKTDTFVALLTSFNKPVKLTTCNEYEAWWPCNSSSIGGRVSLNSWFAINLSGCARQCQPPTPAGSDNATNQIFYCVVPPTWPPWRQMQTINTFT